MILSPGRKRNNLNEDKQIENISMQINTFLHELSYKSNKQRYEDQGFHNSVLVNLHCVSQLKHA